MEQGSDIWSAAEVLAKIYTAILNTYLSTAPPPACASHLRSGDNLEQYAGKVSFITKDSRISMVAFQPHVHHAGLQQAVQCLELASTYLEVASSTPRPDGEIISGSLVRSGTDVHRAVTLMLNV